MKFYEWNCVQCNKEQKRNIKATSEDPIFCGKICQRKHEKKEFLDTVNSDMPGLMEEWNKHRTDSDKLN